MTNSSRKFSFAKRFHLCLLKNLHFRFVIWLSSCLTLVQTKKLAHISLCLCIHSFKQICARCVPTSIVIPKPFSFPFNFFWSLGHQTQSIAMLKLVRLFALFLYFFLWFVWWFATVHTLANTASTQISQRQCPRHHRHLCCRRRRRRRPSARFARFFLMHHCRNECRQTKWSWWWWSSMEKH